jgi:hypothetical protein
MFSVGSVSGNLVLDINGWQNSIKKVQQDMTAIQSKVVAVGTSMKDLGQSLSNTGRQISRVGTTMAFLGTGILAPLTAAFFSAAKYSNNVRVEVDRLNNVFLALRRSIGESLVPVFHNLTNILADFVNRWLALSPAMRENILKFTFMVGAGLVLGGMLTMIIGKIITLGSAFYSLAGKFLIFAGLNPEIVLLVTAVVALGWAMWKFGSISTPVLNTVETGVLMVAIGYEKLTKAMMRMFENSARFWGDTKQADWLKGQAEAIQSSIDGMQAGLNKMASTGVGNFAGGFNEFKDTISGISGLLDNLGSKKISIPKIMEAPKTFAQGWTDSLNTTINALGNFGDMASNIITQMTSSMQSSFSSFFDDVFHGQLKRGSEYFAQFGESVLSTISEIIARLITLGIIEAIVGIFTGGAGISNIAENSFATSGLSLAGHAEGIESTPYTGLYKLHEGEKVVPKYDANKSELMPLTIYNMITPETIAAAMSGKEGSGVIVNVINLDSLRNGVMRREVKRR